MSKGRLLLSVHPQYAGLIATGRKSAELRRLRPRAVPGDIVLFYATRPIQSIVVQCRIERIVTAPCESLWPLIENKAAISRDDYLRYFIDRKIGHAIFLCEITPFDKPIRLDELRLRWPGFRPPQSFRYVPADLTLSPRAAPSA